MKLELEKVGLDKMGLNEMGVDELVWMKCNLDKVGIG